MIFPAFAAAIASASRRMSRAYHAAARAFRERDARSPPEHRLLSSGRGNGISGQDREYLVPWNLECYVTVRRSAAAREFKPRVAQTPRGSRKI
jgi:hypothetical protein